MTNKNLYHLSPLFLLGLFTSCSLSTDNDIPSQQYIAVQAESGDDWSIIDSEGNVIVEEEYDADDQVSPIYDKTYWVKSDNTYQLYSIDNPKKPLNDEEYTAATIMFQGRCLATKAGHPIQILNDEGEVVATLPRDIVSAIRGSRTTFLFEKADGTYGWTDLNGNIIQQGYKQLHTGEGTIVAVGKKTDEGKWLIYNNKGNQTGSFKGTYSVLGISYGYISVKAENDKAMLLNHGV